MADDTIDLLRNYLLLEPDGTLAVLPGGSDFWSQLMSGDATDPGIRRLMGSEKGRLLSALSTGADWTNWEMHPGGVTNILFMLEGKATFVLELSERFEGSPSHRRTFAGDSAKECGTRPR